MDYTDALLKDILTRTRRIAVVGVSGNPVRPSYYVARYLGLKGFDVVPVNPGLAGQVLFGKPVAATLGEIEGGVDMVDIFRRSEAVPEIVEEALEAFPALQTIWMQIGVTHPEAAARAEARGGDGDPEPLPEDRVPAAVRRAAHGRVQHRRDFVQALIQRTRCARHDLFMRGFCIPSHSPAGYFQQKEEIKAFRVTSSIKPETVQRAAFSAMPDCAWRRSSSASTSSRGTSRAASMTRR